MFGSPGTRAPLIAETWPTESPFTMAQPPVDMLLNLVGDFGLRMIRLFGLTCVVTGEADLNGGWIYSGPMPPELVRGSPKSGRRER